MKPHGRVRAAARVQLHITGDQFGTRLPAHDEDRRITPETLRRHVLAIAAGGGSDQEPTRERIMQRSGRPLYELEARSRLDAIGTLTRGPDRRNGRASAA